MANHYDGSERDGVLVRALSWALIVAARKAAMVYGTFPPLGTTDAQRGERWAACYSFLFAHDPVYAQARALGAVDEGEIKP